MALQLDDTFLNDLGLGALSEEKKQGFLLQVLEMLEMRVGERLAEELSDEQVKEFERIAPNEGESDEVTAQKQKAADEWLRTNRPDYDDVVNEELALLKHDLLSNLDTILGKPAA